MRLLCALCARTLLFIFRMHTKTMRIKIAIVCALYRTYSLSVNVYLCTTYKCLVSSWTVSDFVIYLLSVYNVVHTAHRTLHIKYFSFQNKWIELQFMFLFLISGNGLSYPTYGKLRTYNSNSNNDVDGYQRQVRIT